MEKGSHIGHCQACGAQQVVIPGQVMAKHGYKVAGFGYFAGVCRGAGQTPLEVSREFLDATVVGLTDWAARADQAAADFKSGARTPSQVQKRNDTGYGLTTKGQYRGRHWVEGLPIMIGWDAANAIERSKGLAEAIERQEFQARQARDHIDFLINLAARVYSQPLKVRSFEKVVKPAPATVDVAAVIATGTCEFQFKTKAARKQALERVSHEFDKLTRSIRDMHLALPSEARKPSEELYFTIPHNPHEWRPKHAAACLAVFPKSASIVEEIEKLIAARNAIKAAP